VIFSVANLRGMERYLLEKKKDIFNNKDIGEKRYKQLGKQMNAILNKLIKDNSKEDKDIQINQKHLKQNTKKKEIMRNSEHNKIIQNGKQIKDIDSMRDLKEQTIENHHFK